MPLPRPLTIVAGVSVSVGTAAAYLGVAVLQGESAETLQAAIDAWLDAHIAAQVIAIELTASDRGPIALIVHERERRVRRS